VKPEQTWYQRVIQSAGDVLTGRRYWRNRAQALEDDAFGIGNPYIQGLLFERNRYREEVKQLRLAFDGLHVDLLWFKEAKKANEELDRHLREYQKYVCDWEGGPLRCREERARFIRLLEEAHAEAEEWSWFYRLMRWDRRSR
jgi:hypothetical protein